MAHGGRAQVCTGPLKNLTTGLIWLVTSVGDWGRREEVAHGGRARGEMGGGIREQSVRVVTRVGGWGGCTGSFFWAPSKPNNWSDLAGDEGGGMGAGVGRWPMEGGQGGRWGGPPESSVGATKGALVPCFGLLKT